MQFQCNSPLLSTNNSLERVCFLSVKAGLLLKRCHTAMSRVFLDAGSWRGLQRSGGSCSPFLRSTRGGRVWLLGCSDSTSSSWVTASLRGLGAPGHPSLPRIPWGSMCPREEELGSPGNQRGTIVDLQRTWRGFCKKGGNAFIITHHHVLESRKHCLFLLLLLSLVLLFLLIVCKVHWAAFLVWNVLYK